jgi:hypothetical protein
MIMECLEMPRRQRMFRLDDRILNALEEVSKNAGHSSVNQFVETTLFNLVKAAGKIPADSEPLPETRGGDKRSKKPKLDDTTATPNDEN